MSEAELSKYFLTQKVPYVKPFYAIDYKKESEVLDWFREAESSLSEYFRPLFREQKENLAYLFAAGVNPHFATPFAATFANTSDIYAEPQAVFINELYRVVVDQVSLVVSNELVPDVLPNTDDYSDKVAANVTRDWLESMNYDLDTEAWRYKWEMQKKVFGEAYAVVMWNPQKGDLHPFAKEYINEDIDYLDEEGKTVNDLSGMPMKLKKALRIGDIEFFNPFPWDVQEDPKIRQEDREWFYWKEYKEVDYLKKKYPKHNWDATKQLDKYFDAMSGTEKDDPNRRTIYYFYHKSSEFLPEGRFIVCSADYVLKNMPLEMPTIIDDEELPLVRWQDLQIGATIRGAPILFRNCKSLADSYNNITNQMVHNVEMESPKMFVHEMSGVDAQRMPNGTIAIEWQGNIKPTIETPSTNTSSIFNLREALRKNIDEMALQTPMVRGDVPNAQLDSFVALQHFEDLRNQLAAPDIKSHIRSMEKLYRLMITIAKDKYNPDDQRLIKILGKHNSYQLRYFEPINLGKVYDVKIHTTGNLANSKAARTQMMISIKRDFPHLVADEQFTDLIGLSHNKKFMNVITAAVSSAEAENQDMMGGKYVLPPSRFEDLITHWETHRIPMQTLDFKQSPDEVKDLFIAHVAATEKLMFEQAAENPNFGARLENLRQFPMFYTAKPVNEPVEPPIDAVPPEMPPMDAPLSPETGIPEQTLPQEQLQQAVS